MKKILMAIIAILCVSAMQSAEKKFFPYSNAISKFVNENQKSEWAEAILQGAAFLVDKTFSAATTVVDEKVKRHKNRVVHKRDSDVQPNTEQEEQEENEDDNILPESIFEDINEENNDLDQQDENKLDHYKMLEISRLATLQEVKAAYRTLARRYHPDRNHNEGAGEKFNAVKEAYETLVDEEKRARYDAKLQKDEVDQVDQVDQEEDIFAEMNDDEAQQDEDKEDSSEWAETFFQGINLFADKTRSVAATIADKKFTRHRKRVVHKRNNNVQSDTEEEQEETKTIFNNKESIEELKKQEKAEKKAKERAQKIASKIENVITICQGDIIEQDVQAIVNSTGRKYVSYNQLRPLEKSIAQAALKGDEGNSYEEWRKKTLYDANGNSTIKLGDAACGPAFALEENGIQHIIYIANPDYSVKEQRDNREHYLASIYYRALHFARINKIKSIAFPIIGTDSNGFGPKEVARIALKVVRYYLYKHPSAFKEVRFVCATQGLEKIYRDEFVPIKECSRQQLYQRLHMYEKNVAPAKKSEKSDGNPGKKQPAPSKRTITPQQKKKKVKKQDSGATKFVGEKEKKKTPATKIKHVANNKQYFKNCGTAIIIGEGEIQKVKNVDAIVNASNKVFIKNRKLGGVAKAIANAMIADDAKDYANWRQLFLHGFDLSTLNPFTLNVGSAAVGPAFTLEKQGIKNIIHVVGPDCRVREEKTKKAALLAQAYYNALKVADENKLTSIAFSPISTGVFEYPADMGARMALIITGYYLVKNPLTSLKEIHFVLYPDPEKKTSHKKLYDIVFAKVQTYSPQDFCDEAEKFLIDGQQI